MMKSTLLLMATFTTLNAFTRINLMKSIQRKPLAIQMTSTAPQIPIEIFSREFEITPSLKDRVEKKIGKVLSKLGSDVNVCHVKLRVHKFPIDENHSTLTKKDSQISEVTLSLKGGSVIRASERTEDMYASIDLMAHRLAQKLKKHNDKANDKDPKSVIPSKAYSPSDDTSSFNEESLLIELDKKYKDIAAIPDPFSVDMSVVKPKSFPMPPISVEEAVLCLYYIDHPFYVFRNKETNEINVVYKRNSGGVGHIMPERD